MAVVISMLRGVNVGGHNCIRMEALRAVYESAALQSVQTYVQSGNVVFRTQARDLGALAARLEDAIERAFGFRPAVILRSVSDLRNVVAGNPFAARAGIDARKLQVLFLAGGGDSNKLRDLKPGPEEFHLRGRELYVYYPNGMGRSKLSAALLEKTLKTPATGRNWNTVTKVLEIAEKL